MNPTDIKYTKDHEWVRCDGDKCVVGITAFAAEQLGDVTYVELPDVGSDADQGDVVAAVESVKAASDVYAPVSGTVSEANGNLNAHPELVNSDPYGDGWFFKMSNTSREEIEALLSAADYEKFVGALEG